MKYITFTYVDAATGAPVTDAPASNGPAFPSVIGLEFAWARESRYPTETPEFFGTCPDDADIAVPGVLRELSVEDFESMRADEMRARIPQSVTMRQARLALLNAGFLDDVDAVLSAIPDAMQRRAAQIAWEYAQSVDRSSAIISTLGPALGMTDDEVDALFIAAAKL